MIVLLFYFSSTKVSHVIPGTPRCKMLDAPVGAIGFSKENFDRDCTNLNKEKFRWMLGFVQHGVGHESLIICK